MFSQTTSFSAPSPRHTRCFVLPARLRTGIYLREKQVRKQAIQTAGEYLRVMPTRIQLGSAFRAVWSPLRIGSDPGLDSMSGTSAGWALCLPKAYSEHSKSRSSDTSKVGIRIQSREYDAVKRYRNSLGSRPHYSMFCPGGQISSMCAIKPSFNGQRTSRQHGTLKLKKELILRGRNR